jgi:hypothetical protein
MAAGVVVVVVALTRTRGLRVLPFATLIPVILGMTFLLKIGAAGIDARFSARPVAREIESLHLPRLPLAGFAIPRETEYGLAFYRNQQLLRYERSEVPAGEHLLITATQPGAPNEPDFGSLGLAGRKLVQLGGYRPQGLQFFWVSASAK